MENLNFASDDINYMSTDGQKSSKQYVVSFTKFNIAVFSILRRSGVCFFDYEEKKVKKERLISRNRVVSDIHFWDDESVVILEGSNSIGVVTLGYVIDLVNIGTMKSTTRFSVGDDGSKEDQNMNRFLKLSEDQFLVSGREQCPILSISKRCVIRRLGDLFSFSTLRVSKLNLSRLHSQSFYVVPFVKSHRPLLIQYDGDLKMITFKTSRPIFGFSIFMNKQNEEILVCGGLGRTLFFFKTDKRITFPRNKETAKETGVREGLIECYKEIELGNIIFPVLTIKDRYLAVGIRRNGLCIYDLFSEKNEPISTYQIENDDMSTTVKYLSLVNASGFSFSLIVATNENNLERVTFEGVEYLGNEDSELSEKDVRERIEF